MIARDVRNTGACARDCQGRRSIAIEVFRKRIGMIQAFNEGLTWKAPGSDWTKSIVFAILIAILVFRPEGLLGERTPEGG